MANLIDALLAADAGKLSNKRKETMEIPRLSKALGVPFVLTLQSIPSERMDEINEMSIQMSRRGAYQGIDLKMMRALILVDGIASPDMNNAQLKKKFGAATPKELIGKLFLAGEIVKIQERIQKLSGFDVSEEEGKETVKN